MLAGHHPFFVILPLFGVDADGGGARLFDVGGHRVLILVVALAFRALLSGEGVARNVSSSHLELFAAAVLACAFTRVLVFLFASHAPCFHDVFVGCDGVATIAPEIVFITADDLLRTELDWLVASQNPHALDLFCGRVSPA